MCVREREKGGVRKRKCVEVRLCDCMYCIYVCVCCVANRCEWDIKVCFCSVHAKGHNPSARAEYSCRGMGSVNAIVLTQIVPTGWQGLHAPYRVYQCHAHSGVPRQLPAGAVSRAASQG
ncbi:hypothetical protein XENTR_v10002751 [Xenopus tropicalis]|nr:hypothetical protein XENTR_v10002751 [Xenopus tropicalis]